MKLNLGCGQHRQAGFVHVDREGEPDVRHDLEMFPWPWPDSSVEEVLLSHVLEHLGQVPAVFFGIMQELYRVCEPQAIVQIIVPHPRHDHFLGDPTHVRPITREVLSLFSRRNCERWLADGSSNSPLALRLGVDFEIERYIVVLEPAYKKALDDRTLTRDQVEEALRERSNIARELRFTLRVVK